MGNLSFFLNQEKVNSPNCLKTFLNPKNENKWFKKEGRLNKLKAKTQSFKWV